MKLIEEIRLFFSTIKSGARKLKCLPQEHSAYVIKLYEGFGVAVEYPNDIPIFEKFANSYIQNCFLTINNIEKSYLILICEVDRLKYEFASICAEFVDPGEDGERRRNLIDNPFSWWEKWKILLGNSIKNKEPYSILAELIALDNLYKQDPSIEWSSINGGSHDIETETSSYEVKASLKKYETSITISSQYQLKSEKPLFLYFCRMEESEYGISINDIIEVLYSKGYPKNQMEYQLSKLDLQHGASNRNKKFKVLEKRKYIIDSSFPKITNKSFKNNTIPDSITKITYTVDLSSVKSSEW